jgi:hypothetical protein
MYIVVLMDRTKNRTISEDEQGQACLDFFDAVDALANDSLADVEERKIALELQAQISAYTRLHQASLISVLTRMSNSETKTHEERKEAKKLLKHLADHLHERGTDISQWVESGSKRLQ